MKFFTIILFFSVLAHSVWSQTQNDTIYSYLTETPVVIDGQATEECWENAQWNAIDQVWIPWNAIMDEGDFEGRFKVAWDESYLYVLVEVVDDMLSDDHSNPLSNWWEDDCLEIFIDENRSKGNHERNNNAFAYHISLFYDVIDLNQNGQGINYKDHIEVVMDTIGPNTYLWEMAIKIYDESYQHANPESSRVDLFHEKLMGFAVAYCDNDETTSRENFIGSMVMTSSTANEMYRNADYFGPMVLIDPGQATFAGSTKNKPQIKIYPNPAQNYLTIESAATNQSVTKVSVSTISGQVVKSAVLTRNVQTLNIHDLDEGLYLVEVESGKSSLSKLIIKR